MTITGIDDFYKTLIIGKIVELESFKSDFLPTIDEAKYMDGEEKEEYLNSLFDTYHGVDIGPDILILNETSTPREYRRTFYLYTKSTNTLREATEDEDGMFRMMDDNYPLREWKNIDFIVCKNHDNSIEFGLERGDE